MPIDLQGLIFDFDGTISNSMPFIVEAFRNTFQKFTGRRFADEEIWPLFGPSDVGIVRRVVPDRAREAWEDFLKEYEAGHRRFDARIPGLDAALRRLAARGIRLGVVTGKSRATAEISLRYLDLDGLFDTLVTGSPESNVKPEMIRRVVEQWRLPPGRVAYVGDMASDIRDAREAGVIALAAAWVESAKPGELAALEPYAIFRSVEEFARWIEQASGPIEQASGPNVPPAMNS